MSTDKQIHMLDELRSLLEEQIELARHGNSAGERIEAISKQTDSLVQEIAKMGILERAELENQRKQLQNLYDSLHLALTAQKADVADKLSQVHRGKKIAETYRSNI